MSWKEIVEKEYPKAILNSEFTRKVIEYLDRKEGFTAENTLFAESTCPDEINRSILNFAEHYGEHFVLGGLAGYPHTGKTGFAAFSHHIDHGNNLMVVYASHIGVTDTELGKIQRVSMNNETTSCGSLMCALAKLKEVYSKGKIEIPSFDENDSQQYLIGKIVARNAIKIMECENPAKIATEIMYDEIEKAMNYNINSNHGFKGRICLIGGIQINTPPGEDGYFLPKRMDLIDTETGNVKSFMDKI